MPYKDIDRIKKKIDDPTIREWADSLQPYQTSKLLYLLQFWAWAKKRRVKGKFVGWVTAKQMLDDYTKCKKSGDPDDEFKHLGIAKEFVKGKGTSPSDRMNAMSAIKAFYRKYNRPLQDLDSAGMMEIYSPTVADTKRSAALTRVLTPVDVAMLVRGAKMPYQAIFLIMFGGALDASGFVQFNNQLWGEPENFDLKALDSPGPVKINGIVRTKTSFRKGSRGGDITVYYTYIGEDAKMKIKEWLPIRRQMLAQAGLKESPYLFFNWRRGGRQKLSSSLAPITGPVLRKNLTDTAKRLGLIHPPPKRERSSRTRYYFHGHEMRDCFGSMCTPSGVDKVAREFFMGHDIDKLRYDKSPYNPQYFSFYKGEYRKVMRSLDILSNPPTAEGRFQHKETLAAINRQNLLLNRVPRKVVDGYTDEQLASMTVEEMRRLIRAGGKDSSGTATDGDGWEPGQQKVVAAGVLREWVERGWRYVDTISTTGEVVIRYPESSS
jgi:hypothetical protein